MNHDSERRERINQVVESWGVDLLVCFLPENILMLSGFWPVVGTSVAAAGRDGAIRLLVPEDELELARTGWGDNISSYSPGSLDALALPPATLIEPLRDLLGDPQDATIGYEDIGTYEGSSYAAMFRLPGSAVDVIREAVPNAAVRPASAGISQLRSSLTPHEVSRVRMGCELAGSAFTAVSRQIAPGMIEAEVASSVAKQIEDGSLETDGVTRAGSFVWCMSGPNSALAGAAYARSTGRELQIGDLVLVHCNSYIDGYWTDITRTYCLGPPSSRQREIYDAVLAARTAALDTIRPGVACSEIDATARDALTDAGFGQYFTHGLGHNVGFSVISNEFPPRLHPASPDILEVGMTFNVEPAVYIKGFGGIRHCDVVTVHEEGPEVLTPFQRRLEDLVISPE